MNKTLNGTPSCLLITGASSGIGEALAKYYAKQGVTLFLSGRNRDRLDHVAEQCRKQGASCEARQIDVCDRPAMKEWIDSIEENHALDLVIANAGISGGTCTDDNDSRDSDCTIFEINVGGVLNTIHPALSHMTKRGYGQLAIISSIASFTPLPGAAAYAASKAAVRFYGEALAVKLKPSNIKISVICPGFIESRMTDANNFPMPFIMPAEKAAGIIAAGLEKGKTRIEFPWPMVWALKLASVLPPILKQDIFTRLPEKDPYKKSL